MSNYVEEIIAEFIARGVNADLAPFYAQLVLTTGGNTTRENVHDAWALWKTATRPDHRSIIPFAQLTPEVQELDQKYVDMVRSIWHRTQVAA